MQSFIVLNIIFKKVSTKAKYLIIQHLFLSIVVSLLDIFLYFLIASDYKEDLSFGSLVFSPFVLVISTILIISFARLGLLYSTVLTTAFVGTSLHTNLLYSYLKIPYIDFKKKEQGFYINKLAKHVELAIYSLFSCFQLIICVLTLIISSLYVFYSSDFNTIFLISLTGLLFLGFAIYVKEKLNKVSKTHQSDLNNRMLANVELISSFREIFFSQSLNQEIFKENKNIQKTWLNGSFIAFYSNFTRHILEPIILISAVVFLLKDNSLEVIFGNPAILFSLLRAISVIQTLFSSWANLTAYKRFAFSVCTDINYSYQKENLNSIIFENLNYSNKSKIKIELKNISFKYNEQKIILDDFSFCFRPGVNLLMGRNGSGKSTLLDIISGLISPDDGEVFIEDIPIWSKSILSEKEKVLKKDTLKNITYLSQNQFIRNDTILKYITGSKMIENCDIELLKKIIEILGMWDFVGKGFIHINRMCGENGNLLSGGQKQKVALARALYQKPRYLFLDESLSNIDTESKIMIIEKIENLKFIKIILLISHDFIEINNNFQKCFLKRNETYFK